MMHLINLSICNINVQTRLDSSKKFYPIIQDRYRNFLIPSDPSAKAERRWAGKKSVDVSLKLKTSSVRPNNGFSNNQPVVLPDKNGWLIKDSGFHCKLSNKNGLLVGSGTLQEDIYTFDSLLRVLWTQVLLMKHGFLVHACGIRNGSEGYLFPGSSGRGKTTLARKAPRSNVFSDELVGIVVTNKRCLIMGTPFWGEFQQGGTPIIQSLKGTYFLEQSKYIKITEMSPQVAMRNLLKCVLFFSHAPTGIKKLLGLVKQCVSHIPNYKIHLSKKSHYNDIIKTIVKYKRRIA